MTESLIAIADNIKHPWLRDHVFQIRDVPANLLIQEVQWLLRTQARSIEPYNECQRLIVQYIAKELAHRYFKGTL